MKALFLGIVALACGTHFAEARAPGAKMKTAIGHYANLVHAVYWDSLDSAMAMQKAIEEFIVEPSAEGLETAQKSWKSARLPYLQSEAFRFYEGPIDDADGPEGLLNAWPMDEAYVDYVIGAPGSGIVNDSKNFPALSKELIQELNEKDGEENISCGYHAIEFLLWGQDVSKDSAGKRPHTDYTTAKNAKRRGALLKATTSLLVDNLTSLVREWAPDVKENYRAAFVSERPEVALEKIMTGLSVLSGFEMASERLMVAYDTQEQEDEHSCFSDTTCADVIYDLVGIQNVYTGTYTTLAGKKLTGPGIDTLVRTVDADLAIQLGETVDAAVSASKAIPQPFDQAILGEDSSPGRKSIFTTITTLETQAKLLVKAGKALGVSLPISED